MKFDLDRNGLFRNGELIFQKVLIRENEKIHTKLRGIQMYSQGKKKYKATIMISIYYSLL